MRIKNDAGEQEEGINMTPMIDMVFLLLIFFLVATRVASEEREQQIQLPSTSAVQPISAPPRQIIVNIRENGEMVVAGRTYDQMSLTELLSNAARQQPDREVLIRADERSIMRYFANVASICRQAGIGEVKIGYILDGPKPAVAP